jgi:hypothetical protein
MDCARFANQNRRRCCTASSVVANLHPKPKNEFSMSRRSVCLFLFQAFAHTCPLLQPKFFLHSLLKRKDNSPSFRARTKLFVITVFLFEIGPVSCKQLRHFCCFLLSGAIPNRRHISFRWARNITIATVASIEVEILFETI